MNAEFSDGFLTKVRSLLNASKDIKELNQTLRYKTGVMDFFKSYNELEEFKQFLMVYSAIGERDRALGDFQTPIQLTDRVCSYLVDVGFKPDAVIEPTCGQGNFVVSAVRLFPSLKYAYCIDVQAKYEWLFKLNMLKLSSGQDVNVTIEFHRDSIFTHQVSDRFRRFLDKCIRNILILGNPPWVTNTELSSLNSDNLPSKSNIKGHRGIDAITGKGNFDIAEYIILQLIDRFSNRKGKIAMLCKASVIRNVVRDMRKLHLGISGIQALTIDAKREFDISANAALFVADLGSEEGHYCTISSLYRLNYQSRKYGWIGNKFVSDIESYSKHKYIDGKSSLVWRQGVKHDAAKIMVLRIGADGIFLNGLGECVDVEENLIYPLVKGSELRKPLIRNTGNRVIITQNSLNEDTGNIALEFPKTWAYLTSHSEHLDNRKSVIYRGKPRFSIFGIGDYSFKPYKIAISGFYKEPNFSLIMPINGKPVMLDDTCYYLSFESFDDAFYTWILLNADDVREFLSSIVFLDSKRPYTKETLMRIDILRLAKSISFDALLHIYQERLTGYAEYRFDEKGFLSFRNSLQKADIQPTLNIIS